MTFTATFAQTVDLSTSPNPALPAGAELYIVVGSLAGPQWKITISGLEWKGLTTDPRYFLLVCDIPTQQQLDALTAYQRLVAGLRFVNRANGASMSQAAAQAAGAINLAANSTDLSTIYCDLPPAAVTGAPDWDCVSQAYARYNTAVGLAMTAYQTCTHNALVAGIACAVAAGVIGYFTLIGGVIGVLACAALVAYMMKNCSNTLNAALTAAGNTLAAELAACGVTIVMS